MQILNDEGICNTLNNKKYILHLYERIFKEIQFKILRFFRNSCSFLQENISGLFLTHTMGGEGGGGPQKTTFLSSYHNNSLLIIALSS